MMERDLIPRGKMSIVIGGQAGSEAKGKLSAYLCDKGKPDLLVMTSSPNAGHTVVLPDGTKKVSYNLPIGSVYCDCPILLTPASIINPDTLKKEIKDLGIDPKRILVDYRASVIMSWHIRSEKEARLSDLGSTLQGVGACRSSKMNRSMDHVFAGGVAYEYGFRVMDADDYLHLSLKSGLRVLCESTQGFDLDLEHGIDPHYCTSKMINTSMILAEAGVPPQLVGEVYGVIRPYPIRVNNRTGTSGPYAEAEEIGWDVVAHRCKYPGNKDGFGEITTTTKLPRRVFTFSWERFRRFIDVCRPTQLCLQFGNYVDWNSYGKMDWDDMDGSPKLHNFILSLEEEGGVPVNFVGTGPGHDQMVRRPTL